MTHLPDESVDSVCWVAWVTKKEYVTNKYSSFHNKTYLYCLALLKPSNTGASTMSYLLEFDSPAIIC